ncbi:MAG: bis(5'-nucleosyl)-tetraphosphatase (symmetrical) YqeK [Thermoleophilia bacterium]
MEDELRKWLKGRVSAPRFQHSISVLETVAGLADRHGVDQAPLRMAALLHDCARELPNEELVASAEELGLPVREVDRMSPVLLHGKVAAEIASRELGITDASIISAVLWHTAGHPEMSLSDKVFYLSDVMEPTRQHDWVRELRELAGVNVDRAVLMAIDINITHLDNTGRVVDPDTYALKALLMQDLNG